jgi:hypothetical protein
MATTPTIFATDAGRQRVYVGYGSGAIGEIDNQGEKAGEIKLGAHPESFQLNKGDSRVYVNLPKSRKVAVLDRDKHSVLTTWGNGDGAGKLPDGPR